MNSSSCDELQLKLASPIKFSPHVMNYCYEPPAWMTPVKKVTLNAVDVAPIIWCTSSDNHFCDNDNVVPGSNPAMEPNNNPSESPKVNQSIDPMMDHGVEPNVVPDIIDPVMDPSVKLNVVSDSIPTIVPSPNLMINPIYNPTLASTLPPPNAINRITITDIIAGNAVPTKNNLH